MLLFECPADARGDIAHALSGYHNCYGADNQYQSYDFSPG
jgi:hypothetical protein